jgi:proteasome lid subunit RPN8/RPN11
MFHNDDRTMITLAKPELEQLKLLAEVAYPEEFCAILLGTRDGESARVTRVLPTPNSHEHPRRAYAIAPAAVIVAQRKSRDEELQILGFVHSHPDHDSTPSTTDLDQALWLGFVYGIVSVRAGKFAAISFYRLAGETVEERRFLPEEVRLITT